MSKESDRGVVLISASFLEKTLEDLLRVRFTIRHPKSKSSINPLFDTFGPLSTFSAKIKICYAMDLIPKWICGDMELIRKLRNSFAHSSGIVQFDSPEVVKLTEGLKAANLVVTRINKKTIETKKIKKIKIKKNNKTKLTKANMERVRFEMSASFIGAILYITTKILDSDAPLKDKENFVETIFSTNGTS